MPNLHFKKLVFNKTCKTNYKFLFIILCFFTTQSVFAQVNNCLDFDGFNDYVELSLNDSLVNKAKFTIEMWVNPETIKMEQSFFQQYVDNQNRIEIQDGNNGKIRVFVCNGLNSYGVTSTAVFTTGQWFHLAMVFNGTLTGNENRLKLYINGELTTLTFSDGAIPATSSGLLPNPAILGKGSGGVYFDGKMDEVRIWHTVARTQNQIQEYMRTTLGTRPGLLASYDFDEGTAGGTNTEVTTLHDNAGNVDHYGTLNNFNLAGTSSNWVSRVYPVSQDNCLQFDGNNDYINLGGLGEEIDNSDSLTIEMWCKIDTWVQDATLFSKYYSLISRTQIQEYTAGNFQITIEQGTTDDGNDSRAYTTSTPVTTGQWFHLAIVFSGTSGVVGNENRLKLYINGQLIGLTYRGTINADLNSTTQPALLGAQGAGLSDVLCNYFPGLMDEVKIWNVARTQVQIQQNMFSPISATDTTGLVAYYNFNQGTAASSNSNATVLNDLSIVNNWNSGTATKNFGVLTNFALTGSSSNWVASTFISGSGTSGDPYQIANLNNLYWIEASTDRWNKYYIQTADIDASSTSTWDAGAGWSPIGNSSVKFTGTYDGDGHTITGLFINRPATGGIGLFGFTDSPCSITKIGLVDVNITGFHETGGLVGELNKSTVNQCFTTGSVIGTDVVSLVSMIGGLVGNGWRSNIFNSYSRASVSGYSSVGGFVGSFRGTANFTYSTGSVSGGEDVGGYIGSGEINTIDNSYWDKQTSGKTTSNGGIGKTTLEMKTPSTFSAFSNTIWAMDSEINNGYAYLLWQNPAGTPLPVELFTFTASTIGSTVKLNWNTTTEVNNYGFEILRQIKDEAEWTKIGFVTGNGNSNSIKSYSFVDDFSVTLLIHSNKFSYKLKQIDNEGEFTYSNIIEVDLGIPQDFSLSQNFPNPFNPSTTIQYSIPFTNMVTLKVFDVLGKEVANLVNEYKNAGNYEVNFDASKLSSGTYFYQLKAGQFTETKKLVLLK